MAPPPTLSGDGAGANSRVRQDESLPRARRQEPAIRYDGAFRDTSQDRRHHRESRFGLRPRGLKRVGQFVLAARHLHAASAAAGSGLHQHRIADLGSHAQRFLIGLDAAIWPGTQGMPRLRAVLFASILSPMIRICSDFGPMKVMLCASSISANFVFSERKP